MGYNEINLNLGCPSKTVVSKGKGSGFLAYTDELDVFLDTIFSKATFDISIKTRVGRDSAEEFPNLLDIFNKYPIKELIIHPRIQSDYYNNHPNWSAYELAYTKSTNSICYNGDINTPDMFKRFVAQFPNSESVMIGRGILQNPGLVGEIKEDKKIDKPCLFDLQNI